MWNLIASFKSEGVCTECSSFSLKKAITSSGCAKAATRKQRNMYPVPYVSLCDYFALKLSALKFVLEGMVK